jgi:hypothetical protein
MSIYGMTPPQIATLGSGLSFAGSIFPAVLKEKSVSHCTVTMKNQDSTWAVNPNPEDVASSLTLSTVP